MSPPRKAAWWSLSKWLKGENTGSLAPALLADEEAVVAEAVSLSAAGDLERAGAVLGQAALRLPDASRLQMLLGAVRLKLGDAAGAADALRRAQQLAPADALSLNLLGLAHAMLLAPEQARECFVAAANSNPGNPGDPGYADAQANAGWFNFAIARVGESSGYFRKWLSLTVSSEGYALTVASARRPLPRVTLICVDCAYHQLAIHALRASMVHCEFAEVIFFTDRDFDLPGIRVVKVEAIRSSAEYSNFLVHQVGAHIRSDFVLVAQYDGFVLHPLAWDDDFLNYDYIGAKILLEGEQHIVGNGGFSLRSKKLLDALADPLIAAYDARNEAWSEDLAICVKYRALLEERYGIRYAPEPVADRFAAESSSPSSVNFGFHNLVHLVKLVDDEFRPVEPPQTRRLPIHLRARTPVGTVSVSTGVDLGGGAGLAGWIRQLQAAPQAPSGPE